jgi:hypothetical protein
MGQGCTLNQYYHVDSVQEVDRSPASSYVRRCTKTNVCVPPSQIILETDVG